MVSLTFLYGRRPVLEFMEMAEDLSGVESVYISDSASPEFRKKLEEKIPQKLLRISNRKELDRLIPDGNHQGAVIRFRPGYKTQPGKLSDWKELLKQKKGPVVVLDRIQDPQNLGSILRSAEALGAGGLILTGKGAPLSDAAVRASSGAFLHLPIFEAGNLQQLVDAAKKDGWWIASAVAAADPEKHQRHLSVGEFQELPPSQEILLIIGHEGEGIKKSAVAESDYLVSIPLRGRTSSLNAGVAAAILIDRIINR